jgi:hypothetical protein
MNGWSTPVLPLTAKPLEHCALQFCWAPVLCSGQALAFIFAPWRLLVDALFSHSFEVHGFTSNKCINLQDISVQIDLERSPSVHFFAVPHVAGKVYLGSVQMAAASQCKCLLH